MGRKYRPRGERHARHEQYIEERFAAYEVSDSHDVENRQKTRNMLRYQLRGYCFELPPVCAKWGQTCLRCPHLRCRENEQYDKEKWDCDFDPDIDRYASLFDCLEDIATDCNGSDNMIQYHASKVDTEAPLTSLLATFANTAI